MSLPLVGPLGLGTGVLGGLHRSVSASQFAATIAAARNAGIRYFDTAPIYGLGVSEQRLGAALLDIPRDDVVVSTKIGRLVCAPDADTGGAEFDEGYRGFWHGVPENKLVRA